ncbi:MAG: endonuclease NucS [Anaerolineae bacterium]
MKQEFHNFCWKLKIEDNQVLLIQPTEKGDTSVADELLGNDSISDEDEAEIEAEEITFGLERDLQSALRANIQQLETGLKIIDGGKERVTEAGRIDITAVDNRDNIVVIELKAGTATPQVIAQILAYMGAIAETDKKPVRGILVAGDFHKRVILAARAIPNLQLKRYSFQFTFEFVK